LTASSRRSRVDRYLRLAGAFLLGIAALLVATDTPLDALVREFFYPVLTGSTEAKPALLLAHVGLMCLLLAGHGRPVLEVGNRAAGATVVGIALLPYLGQLVIQLNTPYRMKAGTLVVITGGGSVGETTSLTHTHALKACVGKILDLALRHVRTKYHYGSVLAKYVPWPLAVPLALITVAAYVALGFLHPLSVHERRGTVLEPIMLSVAGFLTVLGAVDGGFMCKPLVAGLGLYLVWAVRPRWCKRWLVGAAVVGVLPMLVQALIRVLGYLAQPVAPNSVAWVTGMSILMTVAVSRGL